MEIESVDARKLKIEVNSQQRIDETIEGMDSEKKLKFAGLVCEYIEKNFQAFATSKNAQSITLFERPRETNVDRGLKFKLITSYNKLHVNFSSDKSLASEFDLGIACDLLLDLLRYEDSEIVNPNLVVQDFTNFSKQGN